MIETELPYVLRAIGNSALIKAKPPGISDSTVFFQLYISSREGLGESILIEKL